MIQGLLGRKLGMTQVYRKDGTLEGVTAIEAGPCVVTQIKTLSKEKYSAVQLGFGESEHLSKSQLGHLKELGKFKYLRELRVDDTAGIELGQKVDVSLFQPGERVDIIGITKGKGFAGVVKRYHYEGGPKTHGQSDRTRAPGSVGADRPARVLKGQTMAGHMGVQRVTAQGLEVFEVDPARNLLLVRGAVPGGKNALVTIKKARGKR